MKNPCFHIVPMLFSDYSLPSGLLVLLSMGFLPVGKVVERREEKRSDLVACRKS